MSTKGILQDANPRLWQDHHFGLSKSRWHRLDGRSFWVTGAGTGFGRSIALALVAAGAKVFITGRRLAKLEETKAQGRELGINVENCYPIVADITSQVDLHNAIKNISYYTKELFGLVNSAALPQPNFGQYPLSEIGLEEWSNLMCTNLTAQWMTTKIALPLLTLSNECRVLFLTSEAGWSDTLGFGPYNISKAALNALGISFAMECKSRFSKKDIQMNILIPGEAKTEMNQASKISPFSVVSMSLALLSHPPMGPNGHFFHRDGRHLSFGNSTSYRKDLLHEYKILT